MKRSEDLETAQHEAAHLVVGVALGMRCTGVSLIQTREGIWITEGTTYFDRRRGSFDAWRLMVAAGVAWETMLGDHRREYMSADVAQLRDLGARGSAVTALARAAGAMLRDLAPAHARVTRALLARDLDGADVQALARGERLGGRED